MTGHHLAEADPAGRAPAGSRRSSGTTWRTFVRMPIQHTQTSSMHRGSRPSCGRDDLVAEAEGSNPLSGRSTSRGSRREGPVTWNCGIAVVTACAAEDQQLPMRCGPGADQRDRILISALHPGPVSPRVASATCTKSTAGDRCEPPGSDGVWTNVDQAGVMPGRAARDSRRRSAAWPGGKREGTPPWPAVSAGSISQPECAHRGRGMACN